MPIPVGRSGNVDAEGGTEDGFVRTIPMVGPWGSDLFHPDPLLREWVESLGLQPGWAIRRVSPTRAVIMDVAGKELFAAAMAPESKLEELTNDADSDGTDGS